MDHSSVGGRGAYAKTPQRRQDILRAAAEVFAEHGYEASSVRQVAARAGMSETGLVHHFGGKSGLLAAVLEAQAREDSERWGQGGVIPPEHLVELVALNSGRPAMVRLFTKLVAEATSETSQAHDYFTRRYARLREATAGYVRESQTDGDIRPELDADVVAQILLAVMDGLQVQWLYDQNVDMAHALDALLSSWLRPGADPADD